MNAIELVERIVEQLTDSEPVVKVHQDEHGAIIRVSTNGNIPRLVGRHGATIHALSTLAKAVGIDGKHRIKVIVRDGSTQEA